MNRMAYTVYVTEKSPIFKAVTFYFGISGVLKFFKLYILGFSIFVICQWQFKMWHGHVENKP